VLLRLFGKAVRLVFGPLPEEIGLHHRAVAAYKAFLQPAVG